MEVIVNFVPNMLIFLLTSGLQRWYVVRAYVPPNDAPTFHRVEQALVVAPNIMEVILLGNLNPRLQ